MKSRFDTHDSATVARFVAVGLGAALLFFLLTWLLANAGLPPLAAGAIAYASAFCVAYLGQRRWSFGRRHSHGHALPRYVATQIIAALGSGLSGQVAVSWLGWGNGAAALVATIVAGAASFLLSLFWVFPARQLTRN